MLLLTLNLCCPFLFAKSEDVKIVRKGDRTRIIVTTAPSPQPAPSRKGILEAAVQGVGGVAYESTKTSADVMGVGSDIANRGFLTIGNTIAGALNTVLRSTKET